MKRRAFFTAAFGTIGTLFARKAAPATEYDLSRIKGDPWRPKVCGTLGFSDLEEHCCSAETVIGHIQAANAKRFLEAHAEYLGKKPQPEWVQRQLTR